MSDHDPSTASVPSLGADGVLRCVVSTTGRAASLDFDGLERAARQIAAAEGNMRCVLLTGGTNFCTGANVGLFAGQSAADLPLAELAESLHRFVRAISEARVPVVAAVRGWATGAGLSLVCLADVVVAADSARFRAAYPAIGLTPDGGLTWTLPRIIGLGRARDLLVRDSVLTAPEAREFGLVSELVADDDVDATAAAVATRLAGGSPSIGVARRLVLESFGRTLADQLTAEAEEIVAAAKSPSGQEGIAAFLEKRTPKFI